jgi:hypothetical protein
MGNRGLSALGFQVYNVFIIPFTFKALIGLILKSGLSVKREGLPVRCLVKRTNISSEVRVINL